MRRNLVRGLVPLRGMTYEGHKSAGAAHSSDCRTNEEAQLVRLLLLAARAFEKEQAAYTDRYAATQRTIYNWQSVRFMWGHRRYRGRHSNY